MDLFHMVMLSVTLLGIMFVQKSFAVVEYSVGKFPFLMPNVHPYRVSKNECPHEVVFRKVAQSLVCRQIQSAPSKFLIAFSSEIIITFQSIHGHPHHWPLQSMATHYHFKSDFDSAMLNQFSFFYFSILSESFLLVINTFRCVRRQNNGTFLRISIHQSTFIYRFSKEQREHLM